MCVYRFRYPVCNARASCCRLWPIWYYHIFKHYLIHGTIFEKKRNVIDHKMCVLIFSIIFVWNIYHSKKNWARYDQNVSWSSCKVPIILVKFYWNLNFLDRLKKNTLISNFMKIHSVGAELFHADGRTDGQIWQVAFFQFC